MSQSPPSLSPAPRRTLVSSLMEKISPKALQGRPSLKYGKIAANDIETGDEDEYVYPEPTSLAGGERTSPLRVTPVQIHPKTNRPTFCIDSDDDDSDSDSDCDCEPVRTPPELPSLVPPERIPANYICPLTLQIMEDPVHDSCGHTFERRAIREWLDRSHDGEAVCPISRKPLLPLGCSSSSCSPCEESSSLPANELNNNHSNSSSSSSSSSCGYDRVLKRNEGLQRRIQEWKLEHPLYQGVDADYAKRQRWNMLRRNTITADDDIPTTSASATAAAAISQDNSHHRIECPYGGETSDAATTHSDSDSRNHHRLSRFELMLLPQEREVLKTLKDRRSRDEQERLDRSRRCLVVLSIGLAILVWIGIYMARKRAEEEATR